jgi:transcriptional regulator with XRE-family HTH domain
MAISPMTESLDVVKWPNPDDMTPLRLVRMIAARMKGERLRLGLSQQALATRAGIPLTTYRRLERSGEGSIENLLAILIALGRQAGAALLFPDAPPVLAINRIRQRAFAPRTRRPV